MKFSLSRLKKTASRYRKLKRPVQILLALALAAVAVLILTVIFFLRDLPSPARLRSSEDLAVSTKIFDRNGELLYEIFADENRTPVKLSELPPYVSQASIAIEDKNFYRHFGLDFVGIFRAGLNTLFKQQLQGGSTLTQQLVKVSLLSRERTIERKFKEAILTIVTEVLYSKDQILEMYLNHIPYGGTAWGIEAAAQTFFGKPARELSLAEAAYLGGLPQSPTRYSPFGNTPELGKERQKEVLRRMTEDGYITREQADQTFQTPLHFAEKKFSIRAPHFVFSVRDQLVEQYGHALVERGGLRVTTTLDLSLQDTVQASLSAEINTLSRLKVGNGAALVTRPKTGEILAMVGSRDYFDATHEGQINMTLRPRQPGSSIKPLDVATALQLRRVSMNTILLDIPTCFENLGQKAYCPQNYDGNYHGPVTLRTGLANSYNLPAVKTLGLNGLDNFIATASAMGITTLKDQPQRFGLSLALGAGEIPMTEMATAFGVLANNGVKVPLISILKIETFRGKVLFEADPEARAQSVEQLQAVAPNSPANERAIPDLKISTDPDEIYRVLDREVAYLTNDIISDNNARANAFGTNSELYIRGRKVAAKTGTTNDLRDNWTMGFTPEYLTAVWVGNNDNTAMNQNLVSGVTGAAPIWNDIMTFLLRDQTDAVWREAPPTIAKASFCKRSGDLPNDATPGDHQCEQTSEIFWRGTEPQARENVWRGTWIVGQTGLPTRPDDPTDQLKFEEHTLLTDPFTRDYCLDCVRMMVDALDKDNNPIKKPVEEKYFVTAERIFELAEGFHFWRE